MATPHRSKRQCRPHLALTLGEVADLLDVSSRTVRTWANNGLLPHYRLPGRSGTGRDRRFRLADVAAFARAHGLPCAAGADQAVAVTQDPAVLQAVRAAGLDPVGASCAADAGYLAATLWPRAAVLDRAVLDLWGIAETAALIRRRVPVAVVVAVLAEGEADWTPPPGVVTVARPFDPAALAAALRGEG